MCGENNINLKHRVWHILPQSVICRLYWIENCKLFCEREKAGFSQLNLLQTTEEASVSRERASVSRKKCFGFMSVNTSVAKNKISRKTVNYREKLSKSTITLGMVFFTGWFSPVSLK